MRSYGAKGTKISSALSLQVIKSEIATHNADSNQLNLWKAAGCDEVQPEVVQCLKALKKGFFGLLVCFKQH